MFKLLNEAEITIENIPLPWIPKIELYYPDLPQFPIIYINTFFGEDRVIACPVSVSYEIKDAYCNATFMVLTNANTEDERIGCKIKEEISERIGFSNKISKNDVISCCKSNHSYIELFSDLWTYVQTSYGEYIPYGKYYEEIYSIVRFVSAWQPKTGRQSEMRMLYNFMSAFGENVQFSDKWSHLEFYAIPNLHDITVNNFNEFSKFSILVSAMEKLYTEYFTKDVSIKNTTFKVMPKAWKQNKDDFIKNVSDPLTNKGVLSTDEKFYAERLVDAFNRHAWRAAYFISAYMNISKDYASWSKSYFQTFYENGNKLKGYSEKVIACFLQQGFLNQEVIPIDTWIDTFYQYPLGINSRCEFFNSFDSLGKLERVIWLSSQANKTNMKNFFNILWCQRYGVTGNSKLRGVNPIACCGCLLKSTCVGLQRLKNSKVLIVNNPLTNFENNLKSYMPSNENITYICTLQNGIPKKAYIKSNSDYLLVDEFSGYILTEQNKLKEDLIEKKVISLNEFVLN